MALTVDLLRRLLPPNPHLRILKIDCGRLDDLAIALLARPSLHELCLVECNQFTGLLLSQIGEKCRDLRSLSIDSLGENKMRSIPTSDLEKLLSGCSQLESLSLTFDITRFDWDDFPPVWAMTSRKLIVLKMGYIASQMVTELLNLKVVLKQPPHPVQPVVLSRLQKLQLLVDFITDSLVGTISKVLTSLTHLDLEDLPDTEPDVPWDLTNAGLQQINPNGKLKHLSLVRGRKLIYTYFRRVNDQGILLMADTSSTLESICLGGFCRVTDAGIRSILHSCSNLQKLTVCHGSQLTDLVFHDMSATPLSLTHVGLRRCNLLTKLAIMRLACNKDLRLLDLRHCRNLGDESLRAIGGLPKLKILFLDGSNISDLGISYLGQGVASLISLSLKGCKKLTDKCISTIFNNSFGRTLQVLDLSYLPNLSDHGILSLARSGVPLIELRMQNCSLIGDTSVIALASMQAEGGWCGSTLQLLDLYGCGITVLSFRWFKQPYFPRLRRLGLTAFFHRDMVDALARKRPFLQILHHSQEVGDGYWNPDRFSRFEYEVDELQQWLYDRESESDEELLDGEIENDEEMIEE